MPRASTPEKEKERRRKIAESSSKRWKDSEYKKKVSQKISEAKKGKKMSKEARESMKKAWTLERRQEWSEKMSKDDAPWNSEESIRKAMKKKRENGNLFQEGEKNVAKRDSSQTPSETIKEAGINIPDDIVRTLWRHKEVSGNTCSPENSG